jgi:hypothetical protein
MFSRSSCDSCGSCGGCDSCGTVAAPAAAATTGSSKPAEKGDEPIKKMPDPKAKTGSLTPIAPAAPRTLLTPAGATLNETETNKNPFDLDRRYEARVGRAADNSKITGQLFFVHADGGLWVLRYAPLWKEDPNGGSVVLARDREMESYREGDLVTVQGEIVNDRGSAHLGGPLYRARSIQLVDRPQ